MNAKKTILRLVMGCVFALGLLTQSAFAQPGPPSGGGCTNCPGSFVQNTNRNYIKYLNHAFSLIDTNVAVVADTNLYDALLTFPADTNTVPNLQVMLYGTNTLLLRANHFDYTTETTRDFALLICDKAETPVWKNIDFFNASDALDGWLVQGSVPNWKVTDVMYFQISDYAKDCNAFFRAIPYGGAEISFISPQPYDVVSNTIAIQVAISDLSGITNEQFEVTVDGLAARYSLGTNNTITLNTKYNVEGPVNVYLNTQNRARVYNLTNAPDNSKIFFSSMASLPLDFENDTYLLFGSDYASPDIGTNYFYYVTDKPQTITASIYNPTDAHVVASFGGYIPYGATIYLDWNFTEADGVTPYTNDTYAVHFQTSNPTDLTLTNRIDWAGVRTAARSIITYEEEDPSLPAGPALNYAADQWVRALSVAMYENLYYFDFASISGYTPVQIGTNRDNDIGVMPFVLTGGQEQAWANNVCFSLTNLNYSDFNYLMGHGNGTELGGGPSGSTFVNQVLQTTLVRDFVAHPKAKPHWRMRKVAIWSCYSDTPSWTTGDGDFPPWQDVFGIRRTGLQKASWMKKNVGLFGLFIGGELPQGGYSGTTGGGTSVEVAVMFENLWVNGPDAFPGGSDPTYAFSWVFNQIRQISPEIDKGLPIWIGFGYVNYAGVYDAELLKNDISHVKR